MFVITAIVGNNFKNERSLSSASATISSPRPRRALLPKALRRPPITAVGSSPARSSTTAIIDVVAGDRHRVTQPHQLREHFSPRDDRNLPSNRFGHLRVRPFDG